MDYNTGRESEWNEATLKVIRLDKIQSTINLLKTDPLSITDGKFNYVWLLNNVDILYGEGYSKYSDKERLEVDKLRNLAFKYLKLFPPHNLIVQNSMSSTKKSYIIDRNNFEMLTEIIEIFLRKVKDLNDKHGLTTKNKGSSGLF